jgi:preprotein translocase subunit SecG
MTTFLAMVFTAIGVLLVLVVLVQRGRGGGLSGAFGSGGGSSSAFGTKTGDVFTTVTVVLFVVFMLMGIWLNFRFRDYRDYRQAPTTMGAVDALPPMPTSMPSSAGGGMALPPMDVPLPEVPARSTTLPK